MKYLQKIRYLLIVPLVVVFLVSVFFVPAQAQEQIPVTRTYVMGSDVFGIRPMAGTSQIYEFLINDMVVMRYRTMYQGLSARERAQIILERAEKLGQAMQEGALAVGKINGSFAVTIEGQLFITVTEADYRANNSTGEGLANVWLQNTLAARGKKASLKASLQKEKEKDKDKDGASFGGDKSSDSSVDTPKETSEKITEETKKETSVVFTAEEKKMLQLINQERAKAGAAPLTLDPELVRIARLKSQDMIDKNYFDHYSPTYGDPFTMMRNMGVQYGFAGENLAGNPSLDNAHETLMASPGHRKNILNPNYTHVGIGIVEGGRYGKMYTQLFISKR